MDIFSLGHESYIVNNKDTFLLVDPILEPSFGSDENNLFNIEPARFVNYFLLPKIDCVVLSTEHLQHFNPLSLKNLYTMQREIYGEREILVCVPDLFPSSAEKIITQIGYKLVRIKIGTDNQIGSINIRFYMPKSDIDVPFWDSRVSSIYLCSEDDAMFIQSDTKIANEFYQDVAMERIKSPDLLVLTNNFNGSYVGDQIGLDNILPIEDEKYNNATGISLLTNMALAPSRKMKKKANIMISGNGYNNSFKNINHIWSNSELASIVSELSLGITCFSLDIGQVYNLSDQKIALKYPSLCTLIDENYIVDSHAEYKNHLSNEDIVSELNIMARTWMINEYGQAMMSTESYIGKKLDNRRLVFLIEDVNEDIELVLDISEGKFHIEKSSGNEVIKNYPFGVKTTRELISKLFNGDMQSWEFINSSSQWYICSRYRSPFAFLLEYFSESIDQDRAYKTYLKSLQQESFNAKAY